MSDNGTAHVAAELRESYRPERVRAADLSAQQRNALVDSLVDAVNNHAKVLSEMRGVIEAQAKRASLAEETCAERWDASSGASKRHGDRHAAFFGRPFWQRLHWLVTGR